jgi:hypothetical protein
MPPGSTPRRIAAERFHQHGHTRLVLDEPLQHDLVQGWAMISAVAPSGVNDLRIGLLRAVVTAVDVKTGAIKMGKGRDKAQTLDGSSRHETIAFGDSIGIERL